MPFNGSASGVNADYRVAGFTCSLEGWTKPQAFLSYDPGAKRLRDSGLQPPHPADYSQIASTEVEADSVGGGVRALHDRAWLHVSRAPCGSGTSAGGIAVGGFVTHYPELVGAALDRVGVSDLLRFEVTQGGDANIPELGSVKVERLQGLVCDQPLPSPQGRRRLSGGSAGNRAQ